MQTDMDIADAAIALHLCTCLARAYDSSIENALMMMQHRVKKLFGHTFDVLVIGERSWIIGAQVAHVLQRETFNLYRSLKLKNVETVRASWDEMNFLLSKNVIKGGTHSVTLVPYDDAVYFLADIYHSRNTSNMPGGFRGRSFLELRPSIHRRKPAPWDIRKSFKKDECEDRDLSSEEGVLFRSVPGLHTLLQAEIESSFNLRQSI